MQNSVEFVQSVKDTPAIIDDETEGEGEGAVTPTDPEYIRITNLDDGVFYNTTVSSITIPDYMERIGNYTFYNCDSLNISKVENENFLNSIKEIGDYAFAYSDMISFVRIPSTVEIVGDHSFESLNSLTEIDLLNAVIGDYMFANNTNTFFTTVVIPASINNIGTHAFAYSHYICG